jgi:hypothetical protein
MAIEIPGYSISPFSTMETEIGYYPAYKTPPSVSDRYASSMIEGTYSNYEQRQFNFFRSGSTHV